MSDTPPSPFEVTPIDPTVADSSPSPESPSYGSVDANPSAPLAGLFAGNTKGRKAAFLAFAGASLVVSFGPDLVTFHVVSGSPEFVAWLAFATSALGKVGAALGFVAAANVK